MGLSHGTIANAEEGDATVKTWIKLAEHFGEDPRQILHWAGLGDAPTLRDEYIVRVENKLSRITDPEKRETIEGIIDLLSPDRRRPQKRQVNE